MNHLFFNLFELDLEDEEDSIFMSVLSDIASKYGVDATILFTCEDLCSTCLNLPICLALEVKLCQFYLKHLQEEALYSIYDSFDYSSIDKSIFKKFISYPTVICQISSRVCTRPIPSPSRK